MFNFDWWLVTNIKNETDRRARDGFGFKNYSEACYFGWGGVLLWFGACVLMLVTDIFCIKKAFLDRGSHCVSTRFLFLFCSWVLLPINLSKRLVE